LKVYKGVRQVLADNFAEIKAPISPSKLKQSIVIEPNSDIKQLVQLQQQPPSSVSNPYNFDSSALTLGTNSPRGNDTGQISPQEKLKSIGL